MRRIFRVGSSRGVKGKPPHSSYYEEAKIGRYQVKALLFPGGEYTFYLFRDDVLKAIVGNDDWFISKLDGEGQNLLNRLLTVYG